MHETHEVACKQHQERNSHVLQLQESLCTVKLHICGAPIEVTAVHVQRRVVILIIIQFLCRLLTAASAAAMPLVSAAPAPRRCLQNQMCGSHRLG